MLAGRLAGVLFLTAGLCALMLPAVPGVEDNHWGWVAILSGTCSVWAVCGGYLGELIVICAAYATLGWTIIGGKRIMVDLREQARSLALRDPLTDLPNRRAMLEWLRRHTERDARVGLLLVDLDGFKDV